eukprot:COSAG01_NODE_21406_length_903_cov_3.878109_1_plen_300_part_01
MLRAVRSFTPRDYLRVLSHIGAPDHDIDTALQAESVEHKEASFEFEVHRNQKDGVSELAQIIQLLGSRDEVKKQRASITSTQQWYKAAVALCQYARQTTPPIIPMESVMAYMTYIDWFRQLMLNYKADQSKAVLLIFMRFDEAFRLSQARTTAPRDMLWDAKAYSQYADFKNKLDEFSSRKLSKLESELDSVKSLVKDLTTQLKKVNTRAPAGGSGNGNGSGKGSGKGGDGGQKLTVKERLLKLVSPGGSKAGADHLKKNGKMACINFSSKGGCSKANCTFSHHCPACGEPHSILEHDA